MFKINVCNLKKLNSGEDMGIEIELPICEDELEEILNDVSENDTQEIIIQDYDNEYGYEVGQYDNITKLNEEVEELENLQMRYNVNNEVVECILYEMGNSLDYVINAIRNNTFMVYSNVENNYQLGERLVENDMIGEIPRHLIDFIDYEKIGETYSQGNITIHEDKKLAIEILY